MKAGKLDRAGRVRLFWSKVAVTESDACWEWQGATRGKGYGNTTWGSGPARVLGAHRVAWTLANGPIPEGNWVLHRCDNPPCCNPSHLWLGTNGDNQRDAYAKGRKAPPSGVRKEVPPQT